ncbi:hypothetical protein Mgra_00005862 [Meloidogyne graminicola]|uniref:Uncharacterized protein n=1 Tax=Meloidogyne graminicola TaxID=189291 RepID=A0A8S9ZMR7_9BILA|nr:hypothetical protein Mgra_00005862 [Meloidogyne graminicola]
MSSLCSDIKFINCKLIPFCTISNWLWINNLIYKEENCKPALIQFDGDAILSNKLMKMHALGFYFLMEDGETCNFDAVEKAKKFVKKIAEGKQTEFSLTNEHYPSFSQQQFALYLWILDQFYKFTPTTWLLNNVIYPNAHYLMITI